MKVVARLVCWSALVGTLGCANVAGPRQEPTRDFSVPPDHLSDLGAVRDDAASDAGTPGPDLHTVAPLDAAADAAAPDAARPGTDGAGDTCEKFVGGDAGATTHVYFAGAGPSNTLYTARYTSAGGWAPSMQNSLSAVFSLSMTLADGVPLLVVQETSYKVSAALFDPCAHLFPTPTQIYSAATTSSRPAVDGDDLIFQGSVNNDHRYYHSHFSGTAWSAPVDQKNLLSYSPPTLVHLGSELHSVYQSDTGEALDDGLVQDGPAGGVATPIGVTSHFEPAATVTADGTLVVVYRQDDKNLMWLSRTQGQSFAAAALVCPTTSGCEDTTDLPPVLGLTAGGEALAAFIGTDHNVYTVTLHDGKFTLPIAASGGETTVNLPAVATGIDGATAELVYIRGSDGRARHTRLVGGSWQSTVSIDTVAYSTAALVSTP